MQPDPRMYARWQRPPTPPVTGWWFLVPLFTFGLGTPLMVLIGGVLLRSSVHKVLAGGYLAVLLAACAASGAADGDSGLVTLLTMLMSLGVWIGGTAHTAVLQTAVRDEFFRQAARQYPPGHGPQPLRGPRPPRPGRVYYRPALAYYPPPQHPAWHHSVRVDPALAAAQWRAGRREEARQLQATQPSLANELKVGRPDLPGREYDDGGLVDVNHVPAELLMRYLTIERPLADQIVAVRELHNGFSTPEELVVYCDGLTPAKLDLFRDRLLFVPR